MKEIIFEEKRLIEGTRTCVHTIDNSWKIMEMGIARGNKKNCIRALVESRIVGSREQFRLSHDYTVDERIFHAPCIFVPDVSNPCRIGRPPNFPSVVEMRASEKPPLPRFRM